MARTISTHPFDDDKLKEECGVVGIFGAEQASALCAPSVKVRSTMASKLKSRLYCTA